MNFYEKEKIKETLHFVFLSGCAILNLKQHIYENIYV